MSKMSQHFLALPVDETPLHGKRYELDDDPAYIEWAEKYDNETREEQDGHNETF